MQTILRRLMITGIVCIFHLPSLSQETDESFKPYHRLSGVISHANIPAGIKDNEKVWLVLPSFGFDYDYWISPKWAVGLHSDLIIENFVVETNLSDDEKDLERDRPFATAAVGVFKPGEHLGLIFGSGVELAKEENIFLVRVGADYGWEINERWELAVSLMYDLKWDAYDTWVFGLGVSRILRKE